MPLFPVVYCFLCLATYISLWDSISDLPKPTLGDRIGIYQYTSDPRTDYQAWARIGSPFIQNHTAQNHSRRILEKIMAVPIGGNMSHIINQFDENKVHYEGGYRRARKNTPSYTAYWTRGMTSIHPEQHRFLTPRECARIQSFPDTFIFKGSTIENYTQTCNAVPPLMAYVIAMHLRELLQKKNFSLEFSSHAEYKIQEARRIGYSSSPPRSIGFADTSVESIGKALW